MTGKILLQHNEREITNFNDFKHVAHAIALRVACEVMQERAEFLEAYMAPTQLIEDADVADDAILGVQTRLYKVVFPTSDAGYVVELLIDKNGNTDQWESGTIDISTPNGRLGWCTYVISGFSVQFTHWRETPQE